MKSMDLPGFVFDVGYFRQWIKPDIGSVYANETEAIQFRIVKGNEGPLIGSEEKFITLYNCHNGYYAKGFTFTCPVDPSKDREGGI